jgi:hypothetical protein
LFKIFSGEEQVALSQTEVCVPNQNPIWNATIMFDVTNILDNFMDCNIEVSLWDLVPQNESLFLGECKIDLQNALLEDKALWYRLEDPKNLRPITLSKCQSTIIPHRNSFSMPKSSGSDLLRVGKRNEYGFQRSVSDDVDSMTESTSFLHPDHAYGSRRGSSQSENLEIETYQLGKDFSKSLPGSRR